MSLDQFEFIGNLAAAVVFLGLFHLLAIIVVAVPGRLRTMGRVSRDLTVIGEGFDRGIAGGGRVQEALDAALKVSSFDGPEGLNPAVLMGRVCRMWRIDRELAKAELALYRNRLARCGGQAWSNIAIFASEFGFFFTIIGGIAAFGRIADQAGPLECLGAMGLAMVTTALGLCIAIPVRFLIGTLLQWRSRQVLAAVWELVVRVERSRIEAAARFHAERSRKRNGHGITNGHHARASLSSLTDRRTTLLPGTANDVDDLPGGIQHA
jgi:MotA/TolQ/ExbB proton channel family